MTTAAGAAAAGPATPGRTRWRRPTLSWLALLAVVGAALAFGSATRTGAETTAQRAGAIDAALRCPSCEGLSVADSTAATAVAIRASVLARLRAGQSEDQIEGYFVSRYGPSILVRPPTSGLAALVWVIPSVALSLALVGLAALFWRRRAPVAAVVDDDDRAIVDAALAGPP